MKTETSTASRFTIRTIILLKLILSGCEDTREHPTHTHSLQPSLEFRRLSSDGSLHSIIESPLKMEEKIQRIEQALKDGADINELKVGTSAVTSAVTWGGQYRVALYLLENGADYTRSENTGNARLVHYVYTDRARAARGNAAEKTNYNKLVNWLEAHGESFDEAEKDFARWRSWAGSPEMVGAYRRRERDAREKMQLKILPKATVTDTPETSP